MGFSIATTTSILYRSVGIPTFYNRAIKHVKHYADRPLSQDSPKPIRLFEAELTTKEDTYMLREDKQRIPRDWRLLDSSSIGTSQRQSWLPSASLHNPLLRQQRLGCGWVRRDL
ncbi:hypothetical protein ZOSMA_16G00560 [Zostera marina]|uniref:Uncharacterized protein n=1 Tax=Zostera marina TaxID=29655 RepID=A0A0K9PSZ1_ZOSMR|nr:hypothetical protein ZOSMA_16G00560 [Zostera marina]